MQSTFNNNRFANVSVLSQQQNGQPLQSQQPGQMSNQGQSFLNQPQTASSNYQHPQSSLGYQQVPPSSMSSNSQQFANFQSTIKSNQSMDSLSQKDPSWFNNPKKRMIPQNIVKRSIRQQDNNDQSSVTPASNSLANKSGFNTMTFGSRERQNIFNSSNLKSINTDNILSDSNEAPPMVSIHDWQCEDEYGSLPILSSLPGEQTPMDNENNLLSNGAPKSVPNSIHNSFTNVNAFTKDSPATKQDNTLNVKDIEDKQTPAESNRTSTASKLLSFKATKISQPSNANNTPSVTSTNTQPKETAIVVFGYPESISNSVLTHFSNFGTILEDFEVLRSASGINVSTLRNKNSSNSSNANTENRKYPMFTGDGWVKLTYDSSASALRALQENGKVYKGFLIGCVPYSKNAVEQLASIKIEKNDNIGENSIGLSGTTPVSPLHDLNNNIIGTENKENILSNPLLNNNANLSNGISSDNSVISQNVLYPNNKLIIKDGKSLFVHNTNTNNHNFLQSLENKMRQQEDTTHQNGQTQNNGVLHTVNNWLFGWNNL